MVVVWKKISGNYIDEYYIIGKLNILGKLISIIKSSKM